jgi:hypothetical protein
VTTFTGIKDGDKILVVVDTPEVTSFDPMCNIAAVRRCYRVVADKATQTLELVAIGPTDWSTPLELQRLKTKTI